MEEVEMQEKALSSDKLWSALERYRSSRFGAQLTLIIKKGMQQALTDTTADARNNVKIQYSLGVYLVKGRE